MNRLSERSIAAFRTRMLAWYARNKRAMPWRGTRDAYRVWVSEIMLQQTRVAAVLPYYRRFVKRFPTVQALARARSEEVLKLWAGLGYYSRARNLHRAAREIVAKHGGKFPRERAAALALPGVGRYTAAAVLSIAYGEPLAVLDGNVARVLARLDGVRGDLRAAGRWKKLEERAQELMLESGEWQVASGKAGRQEEVRKSAREEGKDTAGAARKARRQGQRWLPDRLESLSYERRQDAGGTKPAARKAKRRGSKELPDRLESLSYERRQDAGGTKPGEWNQAMMELGATLCTPRTPRCEECPVARWCKAYELGIAEKIPLAREKRATEQIEIAAAVMVDARGRTVLVKPEKAETNGLFSGMWQFPAVEVKQNSLEPQMNADKRRLKKAEEEMRKRGSEEGKRKGKKDLTQRTQRGTEITEKNGDGGNWVELGAVKHSVTYREITLRPFLARMKELPRVEGARIARLTKLSEMAISSATRKIARAAILAWLGKAGTKGAAREEEKVPPAGRI